MEFDEIRAYCLSFKHATEETPFGPNALVYKVYNKMFALLMFREGIISINLKNTPELNIELRESHDYIIPGYHMNKKHWNTVHIKPHVKSSFIKQLIDQSYQCVQAQLPRSKTF